MSDVDDVLAQTFTDWSNAQTRWMKTYSSKPAPKPSEFLPAGWTLALTSKETNDEQ